MRASKVRAESVIGPIVIGLRDEEDTLSRNVMSLTIPDADLPDITENMLLRCYHQRYVTPRLWDICQVIAEQKRPETNG